MILTVGQLHDPCFDLEKAVNQRVTIGKLLKHNGDGFGFKITFEDEHIAEQWKQIIGSLLFKSFNGEIVVDSGGRYDNK